jgi:hypothetical protein
MVEVRQKVSGGREEAVMMQGMKSFKLILVLIVVAMSMTQTPLHGAAQPSSVENGTIRLKFELSSTAGLAISSICDKQKHIDYVAKHCNEASPKSLFEFAVNGIGNDQTFQSNNGLLVTNSQANADGSLSIEARAKAAPLSLRIDVAAPAGESAAIIHITARNTGSKSYNLRLVLPKIDGLQEISGPEMWGALPQEIGSVGPLNDRNSFAANGKFGMTYKPNQGLPHAINSMELATVYNRTVGGGIFFASLDNPASGGVAPLQFNLDSSEIAGYWYAPIDPQQEVDLPGLAIGVYPHGDWHAAVDYYVAKNKLNGSFPQIPAWFRDEGALYAFPAAAPVASILTYLAPAVLASTSSLSRSCPSS